MRPNVPFRPLLWSSFILALPAFGQRPSRSGIGLKIGGQYASLHADQSSYSAVPGAVGGIYFPLWCGPRFELQPELLCSMQGASIAVGDGASHPLNMFYAQFPVSAKFFFTNTINFQGGVQMGKLLSAKTDGADVTSDYQPIDFGFNMGVGADFIHGLDLTLRYYSGLSAVRSDAVHNIYPVNRIAQLTIGYRLTSLRFGGHARRRK